ncbi:hypothetical protein SPHV1_520029 [Novosphingobium sp. KN65.2]|nr:hypothetical protein SPHV1_520029 [Novosphingobium sp. KN65.2]
MWGKGAERPVAIRFGCFLPDLTRFANANVHPTPGAPYGWRLSGLQDPVATISDQRKLSA